jgi:gentisate 1,2-dioxygenase
MVAETHEAALEQLYRDMEPAHVIPTWVHYARLIHKEPTPGYQPHLWRWAQTYPLLMRAGDLIAPERGGERRSTPLVNPSLGDSLSTSHTLGAALQLVRPGETAPVHRHTQGAIRFVIQGGGGEVYTVVQGEKLVMEDNDLILTPNWTWHGHVNETSHDIIWLDVLDYPLVSYLRSSFFEPGIDERPRLTRPVNYTARHAALMRPAWESYQEAVPFVRYPWSDTWQALDALRHEAGSPFDGIILEYVNPFTSGPTLPTISCLAQLLRPGEHTRAHRATSSTIYYVVDGHGATVVDGQELEWSKGDVFVIPPWLWHEHVNAPGGDAVFLAVTDRPILDAFRLYREQARDSA